MQSERTKRHLSSGKTKKLVWCQWTAKCSRRNNRLYCYSLKTSLNLPETTIMTRKPWLRSFVDARKHFVVKHVVTHTHTHIQPVASLMHTLDVIHNRPHFCILSFKGPVISKWVSQRFRCGSQSLRSLAFTMNHEAWIRLLLASQHPWAKQLISLTCIVLCVSVCFDVEG